MTSDKISQNLVKTRADYLRQIYIPWDAEEFSEGNFFDKFLCVIISPLYFCMNITCPVVGDDPKESWNYYLSILQELLEIINIFNLITINKEWKKTCNFFFILNVSPTLSEGNFFVGHVSVTYVYIQYQLNWFFFQFEINDKHFMCLWQFWN